MAARRAATRPLREQHLAVGWRKAVKGWARAGAQSVVGRAAARAPRRGGRAFKKRAARWDDERERECNKSPSSRCPAPCPSPVIEVRGGGCFVSKAQAFQGVQRPTQHHAAFEKLLSAPENIARDRVTANMSFFFLSCFRWSKSWIHCLHWRITARKTTLWRPSCPNAGFARGLCSAPREQRADLGWQHQLLDRFLNQKKF